MKKVVLILILVYLLISNFYSYTYAYGFDENKTITGMAENWIDLGREGNEDKLMDVKTKHWNLLAGVLTGAGIWIILISGSILGIRFMLASPDQKADVKKSLVIWSVGSVIILGAFTIWKILINILDIY